LIALDAHEITWPLLCLNKQTSDKRNIQIRFFKGYSAIARRNPLETVIFVVDRLLFSLFNEAVRLVDEGIADCEEIDTACRLGLGHPLGPFALMDMADLSMALDVRNLLKDAHGERFRFGTALKQRVYAGHRGKPFGRGWYSCAKI
jgi:3-hydroxyacyl-CoA dehydrogenase